MFTDVHHLRCASFVDGCHARPGSVRIMLAYDVRIGHQSRVNASVDLYEKSSTSLLSHTKFIFRRKKYATLTIWICFVCLCVNFISTDHWRWKSINSPLQSALDTDFLYGFVQKLQNALCMKAAAAIGSLQSTEQGRGFVYQNLCSEYY